MTSMTQTISDFETELYQEHLEEASFLYEQRLTLFDDPEITWLDIEDFEERFEARIGDPQTLDHCLHCVHSGNWPFLPLGLGGNRSTAAIFRMVSGILLGS